MLTGSSSTLGSATLGPWTCTGLWNIWYQATKKAM